MQGCIVTSRFPPNWGESRGAPVVKGRSDWFAQCSPGPSRETLPRTGSLLLLSARVNGASTGLQEAVRLGLGNKKSAPPDDDWWAHQILIRQSESAGLPSTPSVASESRLAIGNFGYIIETKETINFRAA